MRLVPQRNRERKQQPDPGAPVAVVESPRLAASTLVERAFEEIYRRMHSVAVDQFEMLVGYDAACDAVNEVAQQLWERRADLRIEQCTEEFFLQCVRYRLVDYLRHQQYQIELTPDVEESGGFEPLPIDPLTGQMNFAPALDRAVNAMTIRRRQAWVLVHEQELSIEEAADVLGVKPATVRVLLLEARRALQGALARAGIRPSESTIKALPPKTSEASND